MRRFAVASALAQKIRVLLGREQLLLRIGLLPEIFLDELAELHQLCQLVAAGRGADMADNLLAAPSCRRGSSARSAPGIGCGRHRISFLQTWMKLYLSPDRYASIILMRALHRCFSEWTLARC